MAPGDTSTAQPLPSLPWRHRRGFQAWQNAPEVIGLGEKVSFPVAAGDHWVLQSTERVNIFEQLHFPFLMGAASGDSGESGCGLEETAKGQGWGLVVGKWEGDEKQPPLPLLSLVAPRADLARVSRQGATGVRTMPIEW